MSDAIRGLKTMIRTPQRIHFSAWILREFTDDRSFTPYPSCDQPASGERQLPSQENIASSRVAMLLMYDCRVMHAQGYSTTLEFHDLPTVAFRRRRRGSPAPFRDHLHSLFVLLVQQLSHERVSVEPFRSGVVEAHAQ